MLQNAKNTNKQGDILNLRVLSFRKEKDKFKYFDNTKVDFLYILDNDNNRYLIPSNEIDAKSGINLGNKYNKFLIK